MPERLNRGESEATIEQLFTGYLQDVKELGLVRGVIVGTEPGRRGAYLWNVLVEDVSGSGIDFTPFNRLNRLGYELKCGLADIVPLDLAHINPSRLPDVEKLCRERKIETDFIPV